MSESYVGNQPNQGLGLPDVQVKDNVLLDYTGDGVASSIDIPLNGTLGEIGFVDIAIVANANQYLFQLMHSGNLTPAYYLTRYTREDKTAVTGRGQNADSYFSDNNFANNTLVTFGSVGCVDNAMFFQSRSAFYDGVPATVDTVNYQGFDTVGGGSSATFLRLQTGDGSPISTKTRILATRRTLESEKVVYANGQSIQKNYLHNTGNWVNQSNYVYGTAVTTISQRLTDRWLANANPSSISYSTVSDPELMTIVGGIYQGIEKNDLAGKVCVLHWEGTAQGSVFRVNGDVTTFKDSPIVFTMPTDVNGTGAMEYVTFGAGTLKHMKLEVGEVPTKWEPEEVATQLNICQRYFQRLKHQAGNYAMSAYVQNATTARCILTYETKRVVPSVTLSLASHYIVKLSGVDATVTAVALSVIGLDTSRIDLTCSGGGMISGYGASASSVSNSAYIDVNAEIL